MSALLKSIWNFRGFVAGSVKREFQSKYRNSVLGALWTVLNPLAMIVVYTVIFSQIMKAKLPGADSYYAYSIYLCAGIIAWGLFAEIVGRSQSVFIDNANLLKKLSFPRICLPIITLLNSYVNFTVVSTLFLGFLIVSESFPGLVIFSVVPVLIIQSALAVGLGMILGVLNVFFRDVGQFFSIFLQFWFWFTPVIYPIAILPKELSEHLLLWNPMAPIIAAYQSIFVAHQQPSWNTLVIPSILSILVCILGLKLFRKRAGEMVDEL